MPPLREPSSPTAAAPPPAAAIDAIRNLVGPKGVVEGDDTKPFLTEWRDRWSGQAALIVMPNSTDQVAQIVKICAAHKIAITPQGGNTGLVGGQIPFSNEILVSLKRMRNIRKISKFDNALTVDAGVTLAEAQEEAAKHDRLFPLSIGSEGTCQIGGVISTNAGGVNVLRYGNMRDLVLGIEAVIPSGEIWNGLKVLRKDNTGYDLKQLFIGGEGTLGIVTGAVLKLFPQPKNKTTAVIGVPSPEMAVSLLSHTQEAVGGVISSFELMSRRCIELVLKNIPGTRDPLIMSHPWYVLAEFSDSAKGDLTDEIEALLERMISDSIATDVIIAQNQTQTAQLWHLRHSISEAMNGEGVGARHDVSVPTAQIPAFLKIADGAVEKIAPGARVVAFGHIGDGNIHYDVIPPEGNSKDALDDVRPLIEAGVYEAIDRFDGSISAEHGVGRHKKERVASSKSQIELNMMGAVKSALDPDGIMNPGKML